MTKATAQMGGLTRQEIEKLRNQMHADFPLEISALDIDALCDLALQAIDCWVPVSERLPEGLALWLNENGTMYVGEWDGPPHENTTHWMPLPPPPERP